MKNRYKGAWLLITALVMASSCKKFDEININPLAANGDQVQVDYFINNSIIGAQMDPHIAERMFVLYWKTAGRQQMGGGISSGGYNDGWSSDYYDSYMSAWLNAANSAIQVGNEQIAKGTSKLYTNNLIQVARIWRTYLMSELSDNFGPIPINSFQGSNPQFASVKDVYYHLLDELKDASAKLDLTVVNPDDVKKQDPAFQYDYNKWKRYANSMRLRLAMRLSEVDVAKAKATFEEAAGGILLTATDQVFKVDERPGWDALTGVMSREWNDQMMSAAYRNLTFNLGGIETTTQVGADIQAFVKPDNYIGLRLQDHFTMKTNDPFAGYWLDGLPNKIDPRALKAFIIPGDFTNPNFNGYPSWDNNAETTTNTLTDGTAVIKTIDAKYSWNAYTSGDWGVPGSKNNIRAFNGAIPRTSNAFRASTSSRIFFANWETYFLLAEGAMRGWTAPMSAKAAYEAGVKANFEYWGVGAQSTTYLMSTAYNNAGTSVSWDHTVEPPASHAMNYKDGYTNTDGMVQIKYPDNTIYKAGAVKNDLLTKIITQKFIAQTPWLPLETWSDHRRLGLPFFENPAVENPLVNLPNLTSGNFMTNSVKNFPQRLRYPSGLKNSNATGYNQAVGYLGGEDAVLTPLWWAKQQ
ncbi:SusD/RagB family nutrient-binding outer membrane lipoprotein [Pedobacter sp. Hv1]|uniref:SusD/RagB family nutrient-binding outer membrane lipoprotein n=1 Tax=Pedobacter sp. Hv1 TaxID=1740090 RepID=UPI0006D8C19C|nr:SusD/RagB family nutrient-binding outer membrane lipoprotein [Pedobacter sp. Hv1]KQB99266.1 susd and RagB outer membrane lipoprotein domain protein [Pedobacter sp. Hv1]